MLKALIQPIVGAFVKLGAAVGLFFMGKSSGKKSARIDQLTENEKARNRVADVDEPTSQEVEDSLRDGEF